MTGAMHTRDRRRAAAAPAPAQASAPSRPAPGPRGLPTGTHALARAVGYEFQLLRSRVTDRARLPVGRTGWEIQDDGGNLEFVTRATDDATQNRRRAAESSAAAEALATRTVDRLGAPFTKQDIRRLEIVQAHSRIDAAEAQPQINADVRIDLVDTLLKLVDSVYPPRRQDIDRGLEPITRMTLGPALPPDPVVAGDADATDLFSNRTSFSSWRQTKPEYHEASSLTLDVPDVVLRQMVVAGADQGVEVAKLRGLMRLMFQYMIHGKRRHMPPPDFMKDLAFLSKSNMGLVAARIAFAPQYGAPGGPPVHELITDVLTTSARRTRDERVYATIEDTPKIEDWVRAIVDNHDDTLASLPEGTEGRPRANFRTNYPTSLGGLGLANTQTPAPPRASGGVARAIPEIVVEFRRIPELGLSEWPAFAARWFPYFENLRRATPVNDL
jgi:hypothetical protein